MKPRVVATAIGVLLCALAIAAPASRLSPTALPNHYDVHLAPDFTTNTFAGRVRVSVRLTQPATAVTLHAAEIEFHDVRLTAGGLTQTATVSLDSETETATFTVAEPLPAQPATIAISYSGQLNDKLRGFYLSHANNHSYAITQLEATDARRAFPSFDEPAMKATFAVSTTIDTRDTAISNGRVISDVPGPGAGKHTMTFATTRRMSTYLVALIVGDWQCVRGSADGTPIRVCGTPDRKDDLRFALEASEFALRYFNRYLAIKYPFDKLDLVAVPDFSAGAMENTGAIVFREEFLLVNERVGSIPHRKQVAQYVAHEIAHQWFGDLVTMKWWDDIWLNEGFATWMERRPMEEWKPEWNPKLDEVRDTVGAMNLDGLRETRPIRTQVETPDQINQVFDAIAYQKTASVVRMVEAYVGASSYRDGINAYLKRFAYGNADGEDFWTTLASTTGKPVDRILSSYITQGSMPLVSVNTNCSGNRTEVSLSQRPLSAAVPASTTWNIPVCYKRSRNGKIEPASCTVLSESSQAVSLDGCSPWVFANVESRGYYRTSYGAEGLKALADAARSNQLTAIEQTSLLEDMWALVRLDDESIADFLSLTAELLKGQIGPAILVTTDRTTFIADRLVSEPFRPAFERWVRLAFRPLADRLGWNASPQESEDRRSVRAAVLYTLGYAGRDPDVLREARRRVDRHLARVESLDPSLFTVTVQLAAINGDAALYNRYLALIKGQRDAGEQTGYRAALSYFSDPVLVSRTLDYATSSEVRTQDAPSILAALMARPAAAAATWTYVKTHWPSIEKSYDVFLGLPQVVGATQNFCDPDTRGDIEQFFDDHPVRGSDRAARQSLETIDRCIGTRAAQTERLDSWLRAHASGPP